MKLKERIFEYFLENYEDETLANSKADTISREIITLVHAIENNFNLENRSLTKQLHTLKHLLLYADIDDASDLCQYLELNVRLGVLHTKMLDEMIGIIVKYI